MPRLQRDREITVAHNEPLAVGIAPEDVAARRRAIDLREHPAIGWLREYGTCGARSSTNGIIAVATYSGRGRSRAAASAPRTGGATVVRAMRRAGQHQTMNAMMTAPPNRGSLRDSIRHARL